MSHDPQLPPLDGSVSVLPGLADFHAQHNPQHPWALFPTGDSDVSSISWLEFSKASHRLAYWLMPHGPAKTRDVVAIIIHCDTILYVTLLLGMARAGLVVRV